MREKHDIMHVTIHAAHLNKDSPEVPLATQLLQKVMHTIAQFESQGWHAETVDQDDIAATITFRRCPQSDNSEPSLP